MGVARSMRWTLAGLGLALVAPLTVVHAAEPAATESRRAYAIEPGPLGNALAQFAGIAGVPLSFDPTPLAAIRSPGLRGSFTVQDGFARLLRDSGYQLLDAGNGGFSLRPLPVVKGADSATLPTVTVTATEPLPSELPRAYAGGQMARGSRLGLLGNADTMSSPFSTSSFTSEAMTNRQAATLPEVLNKDSSVRFTGQLGGVTDSFYIRGLPIGEGNLSEVAFDGVYGVAPNYHVFTEYAERVEVVKGPAALLYGMSPNGGVGGVINIVPKRALPEDLSRVSLDYGSGSQLGEHVDLSRRFGADREWGVRFNGVHREGDTPLDNQKSRTDIGALSLDYQGERLRASLDFLSQTEKVDAPTRPFLVAAGLQVPDAPDGRRNISQPWGWWKSDGQSTLLRTEYDLNDKVTLFANVGGSTVDIARLSDQTPTLLNGSGLTTSTPTHYKFKVDRHTVDAGLRGHFETGAIKHAVSLQVSSYEDRIAQANNTGTAMLTNIYAPIDRPAQNIAEPLRTPKVSASRLSGVALADTLSAFDDGLQFTLGLRHQQVESNNYSASTGAVTARYDQSAVTPMAGVVYKPSQGVSIYANYIEGLSKGDTAPTTASNAGEIFSPYRSKQHEIGVKFDLGSTLATVSAFQVTKPSGQLTGTVYAADSEQRNRGLEFNVFGEPVKGLRLTGGLTLLDGKLTRTNSSTTLGNRPVGVPTAMANLGADWDVPGIAGLAISGSLIYTGREYVNQANTQSIPAWTTLDLGARYTTRVAGRTTTFRGTLANATNRAYWSGVASYGTISQGIPRTFVLSASVDF
ncbi:TonB-dependent siderophore receptor [Variovorax sp. ZT4R33]|uniref:TonB-dependent siderophore receptor n=1 Tax=Variovorax sp. ZT4R33 TaxID=3443743 RepID=UPI003F489601